MEVNDGGKIKILHTGKSNAGFEITGRIKGAKENFIFVSKEKTSTALFITSMIMLVVWSAFLIIPIFIMKEVIKSPKGTFSLFGGGFWLIFSMLIVAGFLFFANFTFDQYTLIDVYPPWY
jgi:hypothetical protein